MNKTQIKELQGAITQMNTNDRAKSTFTIEDNFAYFTPEGHRAYKISVNVLSEAGGRIYTLNMTVQYMERLILQIRRNKKMKKLQTFAASGSCFAPEKIIIGKVIDKITFISDEFTGT